VRKPEIDRDAAPPFPPAVGMGARQCSTRVLP
jgi:hypothetical protein